MSTCLGLDPALFAVRLLGVTLCPSAVGGVRVSATGLGQPGMRGVFPSSAHLPLFLCFPDLTFLHEGSKTLLDGLVNIEKLVSPSKPWHYLP